MNDVRDIMDLGVVSTQGERKKRLSKPKEITPKRPEGVSRELYALMVADGCKNFNAFAEMLPTEKPGGYQKKVKLGAKKVRHWEWKPFINPARKDKAVFHHWRRTADEEKEYPFAKFNKELSILKYTDQEYEAHFAGVEGWTKADTDHLFDLCSRFDLRFPVICDRWDTASHGRRSIEDLKDRYYAIENTLLNLRRPLGAPEPKVFVYDADHERRRKEQLKKLWARTPEQIEEEDYLRSELRKIEARKKEREKKTQDLQKLITAADAGSTGPESAQTPNTPGSKFFAATHKKLSTEMKKTASLAAKRKSGKALGLGRGRDHMAVLGSTDVFLGIKWPDMKTAGVFARSSKMKLPNNVGQKKLKAIEQILHQLRIDLVQIPTEEIVTQFNELRSDIVLLYELKSALTTCEMEIHSISHQFEALTGQKLGIPTSLNPESSSALLKALESTKGLTPTQPGFSSTVVQSPVATGAQKSNTQSPTSLSSSLGVVDLDVVVPGRKRKAALEQSNILKKLKSKM